MKKLFVFAVLLFATQNSYAVEKKMTITGRISGGTMMSNVVTASDQAYDFQSNSKEGNAIFKVCKVDDLCIITGMIEDDQYIRSVSSVKKATLKQVLLTIPANTNKSSDKNVKKIQPIELSGTIIQSRDAAGGSFGINGGKKKQYTLRYVWDLDDSNQSILNNLSESRKKVIVKGMLKIWKDGSASFDDNSPITIIE